MNILITLFQRVSEMLNLEVSFLIPAMDVFLCPQRMILYEVVSIISGTGAATCTVLVVAG
jgi:hypothetical protein